MLYRFSFTSMKFITVIKENKSVKLISSVTKWRVEFYALFSLITVMNFIETKLNLLTYYQCSQKRLTVLSLLFFDIFACDLFFGGIPINITKHTDCRTPYLEQFQPRQIVDLLVENVDKLFDWFLDAYLKTNPDKCYFLKNVAEMIQTAFYIGIPTLAHPLSLPKFSLKCTLCRFENFPICSCSYKNNTLKFSHS